MFDKLFSDVGAKIKSVAEILFIVLFLASIATGAVLMIVSIDFWWAGLLTIVLGPVLAWLTVLLLYGLGELIESTNETKGLVRELKRKADEVSDTGAQPVVDGNHLPRI